MSEIFYRYSMHFSQYINRFIHSMACAGLWLYKSVLYTYTYSSSQKVHYEISSEIFSMVKLKLWLPDVLWITYIWIGERYHCRIVIILSYTIRNSCMELNCKLCYSPWFTHYVIQHSKNTYLDCLSAISCI